MSLMNDSIGIQEINIRYSTNKNPSSESVLTRDMIDIPDEESKEETKEESGLSKYPLFTDSVLLPRLKIEALSRKEQIRFFFDKTVFSSLIVSVTNVDIDERNKNAETNLEILLNILLPTSFPIVNNISNTFSENILNIAPRPKVDDFNIFKLFSIKKNNYGYLKLNGSDYTVSKIILVNDIINDKIFTNLIRSGKIFKMWIDSIKKSIEEEGNKLNKEIETLIKKHMDTIRNKLKDANNESENEATKNEKPNPLAQAFRNMKNTKSAQNKSVFPLSELFDPLEELMESTSGDIPTIINLFNTINKAVKTSNKSEEYIPLSIRNIEGFNRLLLLSKNIKIYEFKSKYLNELSKLIPYLDDKNGKIKDISNFMEKEAIGELIRYQQINAFIKEISIFRPPKRNYTNNALSSILKNVIKGLDTFLEFITFVNDISAEGAIPTQEQLANNNLKKIKTGVMAVSESTDSKKGEEDILGLNRINRYDCCVHVEVIQGRIDDDNVKLIKCPYRSQLLNTAYDKIKEERKMLGKKNPLLLYKMTKVFSMDTNNKTRKQRKTQQNIGGRKSAYKKTAKRRTSRRQKGGYTERYKTPSNKKKKDKKGRKASPNKTPSNQ